MKLDKLEIFKKKKKLGDKASLLVKTTHGWKTGFLPVKFISNYKLFSQTILFYVSQAV